MSIEGIKRTVNDTSPISDEEIKSWAEESRELVFAIQKPDRAIPIDSSLLSEELNLLCCLTGVDKSTLNNSVLASLNYSLERFYKLAYANGDEDRKKLGPIKGEITHIGPMAMNYSSPGNGVSFRNTETKQKAVSNKKAKP